MKTRPKSDLPNQEGFVFNAHLLDGTISTKLVEKRPDGTLFVEGWALFKTWTPIQTEGKPNTLKGLALEVGETAICKAGDAIVAIECIKVMGWDTKEVYPEYIKVLASSGGVGKHPTDGFTRAHSKSITWQKLAFKRPVYEQRS